MGNYHNIFALFITNKYFLVHDSSANTAYKMSSDTTNLTFSIIGGHMHYTLPPLMAAMCCRHAAHCAVFVVTNVFPLLTFAPTTQSGINIGHNLEHIHSEYDRGGNVTSFSAETHKGSVSDVVSRHQ